MPIDFSKYSDEQFAAMAPNMGDRVGPQTNPRLTTVQPSQDSVVFTGAGGIENLPGVAAKQNVMNQGEVDKAVALKTALAPFEVQQVKEAEEARKIANQNIARKDFDSELRSFFSVDESIPRGEGFHRFQQGLRSFGESVGQESVRGIATAAHKSASLKLRTSIARLKDTGNLNLNEQEAAGQMIPGIFDSEKLVELKRAYLKQLGTAIDSGDRNLVTELIDNWRKSEGYDKEKFNRDNNDVDLDELLPPVDLESLKI